MADWYVSSVKYAAVAQWQATHAYVVGDLVRPLATPPQAQQYVFRCTTAGTSASTEPAWSGASGNNNTRTDGTVTWTNVAGQSAYGWNAASGNLLSICQTRGAPGDRFFLASDHSETVSSASHSFNNFTNAFGLIQIISVNRAGSVPPVAADILNGAAITTSSGGIVLDPLCNLFWQGITFTTAGGVSLSSSGNKSQYLKNCAFVFGSTSAARLGNGSGAARVTFDNVTIQFGASNQAIGPGSNQPFELHWINTPSAIVGATLPTALMNNGGSILLVTCRGVDLSAVTGTLLNTSAGTQIMNKVLLDSCKIAAGVTRKNADTNVANPAHDEIELINCFDGTNIINERHTAAGDVTQDFSTTLNGGAADDVGPYSLKLISSSRSDFEVVTLDTFWLDVENTVTGSSKTATVEIISSAAFNNTDIKLQFEYMGTSGSSLASFVESLSSVLTSASSLPSSSSTWNNPPGTPQKQLLQATFTPQTAGRVRGLVKLGKTAATVWVNPQITIS